MTATPDAPRTASHPQGGIATLDAARFSAPALPGERVELLRDGLATGALAARTWIHGCPLM